MALVSNEKRLLFQSYTSEFEKKYLLKPVGQQHLAMYKKERDEVKQYWSEVKLAKNQGMPITDMVVLATWDMRSEKSRMSKSPLSE